SSIVSLYFFFSSRRRHTRSKRDWSSDVCSSDLRKDARASPKNVYVYVLIGLALASFLCALAWNPLSLILFRIVQGFFCGIIMPRSEERRVGKECIVSR